jgi:hypothetical protein
MLEQAEAARSADVTSKPMAMSRVDEPGDEVDDVMTNTSEATSVPKLA